MYSKPRILAISENGGSFAAGCPAHNTAGSKVWTHICKNCERTV